jgi:predicted 3-demethylubiquinone-9 3-methyltransferase (glyoxalase superfamily)
MAGRRPDRRAVYRRHKETTVNIPNPITPCLWFDGQAAEAAEFYTGIFPNSRVTDVQYYPETDNEIIRDMAGQVLIAAFELNGQPFTALNGGPAFKFSEAVSFQVLCDSQDEVDHYWDKLGAGGDPAAQECGWLKDRYGVSWQIVPKRMMELLSDPDKEKSRRAMLAMMEMKKLDIAGIEAAAAG